MLTGPALDNLAAAVARACRSGLDPDALRAAVLPRLRKVVPVDALWWAAADPATLLFTRAYREELPEESGPYFVENEFLHDDVNKWTDLARDASGVRTLMQATDGRPARSDRYRDIFAPLGLQDELRAVLRIRGVCWGYICLHREAAQAEFSAEEVRFVRRLAPHIAEELWRRLGYRESVAGAPLPEADQALAAEQTVSLPVQVNGKTRFTMQVPAGAGREQIEQLLTAHPDFALHTAGLEIQRVVIVPGRIASVVAR